MSNREIFISSDIHVSSGDIKWENWLSPKFKEEYDTQRGRSIEEFLHGDQDANVWDLYNDFFPKDVAREIQGSRCEWLIKHIGDAEGAGSFMAAGDWNPVRLLRELEEDGCVGGLLIPGAPFPRLLFGKPQASANIELATENTDAANRWTADFVTAAPHRLAGTIHVTTMPGLSMDVAIEQVKWGLAHGLRGGVLLPGNPELAGLPLYSGRYWDPLWRACAELGVPINVHAGAGQIPPQAGGSLLWVLDMRWFLTRPLRYFILGGVFERHPKLKLTLIENGASWAIDELATLDRVHAGEWPDRHTLAITYTRDKWQTELAKEWKSQLKRSPSEYFESNVWLTCEASTDDWGRAREVLGAHKILAGNDYPHDDGIWPRGRENLQMSIEKSNVPIDDVRRMLAVNAAELWGFELPKLQPIADRYGLELSSKVATAA